MPKRQRPRRRRDRRRGRRGPAPAAQAPPPSKKPAAPRTDLPPAIVAGTNPYGHAPLRIISTPAAGVADGAFESQKARNAAGLVQKAGALAKLRQAASSARRPSAGKVATSR